jgi:hypothetical protein
MNRGTLIGIVVAFALAGCGSSHTVTVKVEAPGGSKTSTVTSAIRVWDYAVDAGRR